MNKIPNESKNKYTLYRIFLLFINEKGNIGSQQICTNDFGNRQRATDFTLVVGRQFLFILCLLQFLRVSECRAGFDVVLLWIFRSRLTHISHTYSYHAQVAIRFVSFSLEITVALQSPYCVHAPDFHSNAISAQRFFAREFALQILIVVEHYIYWRQWWMNDWEKRKTVVLSNQVAQIKTTQHTDVNLSKVPQCLKCNWNAFYRT